MEIIQKSRKFAIPVIGIAFLIAIILIAISQGASAQTTSGAQYFCGNINTCDNSIVLTTDTTTGIMTIESNGLSGSSSHSTPNDISITYYVNKIVDTILPGENENNVSGIRVAMMPSQNSENSSRIDIDGLKIKKFELAGNKKFYITFELNKEQIKFFTSHKILVDNNQTSISAFNFWF